MGVSLKLMEVEFDGWMGSSCLENVLHGRLVGCALAIIEALELISLCTI